MTAAQDNGLGSACRFRLRFLHGRDREVAQHHRHAQEYGEKLSRDVSLGGAAGFMATAFQCGAIC